MENGNIPESVRAQMRAWAKLGGDARHKKLTKKQRVEIARNAGKASGIARRKNGRARNAFRP